MTLFDGLVRRPCACSELACPSPKSKIIMSFRMIYCLFACPSLLWCLFGEKTWLGPRLGAPDPHPPSPCWDLLRDLARSTLLALFGPCSDLNRHVFEQAKPLRSELVRGLFDAKPLRSELVRVFEQGLNKPNRCGVSLFEACSLPIVF